MSAEYDYLNQLAGYNDAINESKQDLTFENMKETSKQILKDNLIETLGLPASEFFLDKGVRGAAKLIKNNVPKLNNDFINDVQESGLKDAIGNKIAGVKKTVEGKVNDALGDVKNRVEDAKNSVKNTIDDTVNNVRDRVNDTVSDARNNIEDVIGNTINDANDTINDTLGGVTDALDKTIGEPYVIPSRFQLPDQTIKAFKERFDGSQFSEDKINEMMNRAQNPDDWHNFLKDDPNYNQPEMERAREFVNSQRENLQAQQDDSLNEDAVKNLSGSKGISEDGEGIPLKNIGENVAEGIGEGVAEEAGEDAGLAVADAGIEGAAAGLDATGVGAIVGIPLGLAGLIGSLFGIFDGHSAHVPPPPIIGRPSLNIGV